MACVKAATALLVSVIAGVAAPEAAFAAQLDPLEPCYVAAGPDEAQREAVEFGGSGFTPDARLDIAVDGVIVRPSVPVGLDGLLAPGTVPAPYMAHGQRRFTITATEHTTGVVATAQSRVAALYVGMRPERARPSRFVELDGSGFTDEAPIYAHYLYKGEVRKTVRLARPHGPCGRFRVRRRQLPIRAPQVGTWIMQADQRPEYSWPPDTSAYRIRIAVREMDDPGRGRGPRPGRGPR
jgi:hypothetical protein